MPKYNAIDIAMWFVNRNLQDVKKEEDEKMILLKLLKLLYYAEGCSLALGRGSLFDEKILAWEHGPTVFEVWEYFHDASDIAISDDEMQSNLAKISDEDNDFLENVYSVFGGYSAVGLRNKACSETPWLEATNGGRRFNAEIPRDSIRRYFIENYIEV